MLKLFKKKIVYEDIPQKQVQVIYDNKNATLLRRKSSELRKSNIDINTININQLPLETRQTLNQMECLHEIGLLCKNDYDDLRPVIVAQGLEMLKNEEASLQVKVLQQKKMEQDYYNTWENQLQRIKAENFIMENYIGNAKTDNMYSIDYNPFDDEKLVLHATQFAIVT